MSSAELTIGTVVEGVVSRVTKFGAFVTLPGGRDGLVHISEIADVYVKEINDYIKEKDNVKVKIISIDPQGKIGLSIRQAEKQGPPETAKPARRPSPSQNNRTDFVRPTVNFEDRLNKFMKESEEKLSQIKRNSESKRGGRGGRRG